MGKASRRKAMHRSQEASASTWREDMAKPLDPQTFVMMMEVFQAAADLKMPTVNPEEAKFQIDDGPVYKLTDRPLNRGMLEVNRQLMELGVENRHAYTARIMQFGDIIEAADRFGDLIKQGDEPGMLLLDDVIFPACATARFSVSPERFGYDVDDVIAKARELRAAADLQASQS